MDGRQTKAGYNGSRKLPVIRTLRELRVEAGIALSDLQEASGVSKAVISQIERGRLIATPDELATLGAALGIRLEMRNLAIAVEDTETEA